MGGISFHRPVWSFVEPRRDGKITAARKVCSSAGSTATNKEQQGDERCFGGSVGRRKGLAT